ncbi:hypothetical protein C8R43DRAFT_1138932 [Mycena crocata]|nr:hypothetical protein C8R43DRAFT_1138932 [Mycena crocata]
MSGKLGLDPGPGPRRRKTSLCRCLCWSICIPLVCLATWAIFSFATRFVQEARFPHKSLYSTSGAKDIIRPLISDEQSFDIAVTVWARAPEDEEAEFQRLAFTVESQEVVPTLTQIDLGGTLGKVWMSLTEGNDLRDENPLEKPLFSDVVFRNLHLSDKHASAKVDFRLPVERFLGPHLTPSDLRATFLLIPSSPSLLDHVKNFSTWMPESVFAKRPLTRPWPFPLGSEKRGEKTIADLALESFSITIPLIEFHPASFCKSTDEDPVVNTHPYVVTRTQLRIVRETSLFDAKTYKTERRKIKMHSCGQGIPGFKPSLRRCRRTYKSNGNFETLLELEIPTESGAETQWAYAPYLDTKNHSAGPLDLIPVPVNRENCSIPQDADAFKEYMDISWRIAFAGRTPGKQILGDTFVSPQAVNHSASDNEKVFQQMEAELWNGAFGHRFHDDAHPRRRIGVSVVSMILQASAALLLFYYWWSRVSTVGISTSGAAFLAASYTISPISDGLEDNSSMAIIIPLALITPFLMCKALTRAEFEWAKWYPTVRIAPATHQERRSQRIDSRTSWRTKLGFFFVVLAAYWLIDPANITVLRTTAPAPPTNDSRWTKVYAFARVVNSCLFTTGVFSQVLLNHRSHAYGGGYRAEAILFFLGCVIDLLYFVPAVVGRMEVRMGLMLKAFIDLAVELPLVWQAVTLPPAKVQEEED